MPLGLTRGSGTLTMPFVGTRSTPLFMIKAIKSKTLMTDSAFLSLYKGEEKVPMPAF